MGLLLDWYDERTKQTVTDAYAAIVSIPMDRRQGGGADVKVGVWSSKAARDEDTAMMNPMEFVDVRVQNKDEVTENGGGETVVVEEAIMDFDGPESNQGRRNPPVHV